MSRFGKQVVYGSLFLGVIAILVGGGYVLFSRGSETPLPPPGVETESLRIFNPVFFFVGDRVLVAAEVVNPNEGFGARFSYTFSLSANDGRVLRSIQGEEVLGPRETHFVYDYIPGVPLVDVARVDFETGAATWLPADEFPAVRVAETAPARLEEGTDELRVSGRLRNESTLQSPSLRLTVFFRDVTGFTRAITGTRLSSFRSFEERDYLVRLPAPETFARLVRGGKVEIQIYRAD